VTSGVAAAVTSAVAAAVASAVASLVAADQALAQTAIDDAILAGGDPGKIQKAQDEMVKAAADLAAGEPEKAIEH